MWRLLGTSVTLFVLGVYAGLVLPIPNTTIAIQGETNSPYPYANAVAYTQVPPAMQAPTVAATIQNSSSIDARFAGMLSHVRWLLERDGGSNAELERLNKQILSLMDDLSDDRKDSRDDSDELTLPGGFVINDSGAVAAGEWQGSAILDAYIDDVLTIGAGSTLANNIITANSLLTTGQTDEYCLTYESTGATLAWQVCGAGGGLTSSDIDTSLEFSSLLTDETGTGALVLAGSPTLTGTVTAASANFSGNVGIGTTTPTSRLTVAGDLRVTGAFRDSSGDTGTNGQVLLSTLTGTNWVATSTLGISGGGGSLFTDGGSTTYLTATGDSLAIGTTTANEKLTVEGNINISAATGALYFDNTRFLYASSTNYGIYFGELAGETLAASDLYNIALGYQAGRNADSNYNIFAGTYAGYNSSGQHNYLFGYNAGYNNNGAANFIAGPDAGYNNLGGNNFIIGDDAGYNNTGTENFIYGTNAGYENSGSSNFILGASAGYLSTGNNNLFIGEEAGYNNNGNGNILLGYRAATNLTSGSRNIVIGYNINTAIATTSDTLNIGNLVFGTGLDGAGRTLSTGNIGIGTTTPAQKLQVFGNIRIGTAGGNGCVEDFAGTLISGTCSSDRDLKENIEPISNEGRSYLEALAALTPVTYTWSETASDLYSKDTTFENLGLIAQDVEAQFPELVSLNDEGYRQVNFSAFPFYIIEALKEVWQRIQGQDERIEKLEQENEYLKDRLNEIEDELNIDSPPQPAPAPEPEPEPSSSPTSTPEPSTESTPESEPELTPEPPSEPVI